MVSIRDSGSLDASSNLAGAVMENSTVESKDFIREIIDQDIKNKKHNGRVHTRFPPEPNGYLHIGHAKSICLNFGIAKEYMGKCNLRFDDTNPVKEEQEYIDSIIEDVHWLGFDWEDRLCYGSDYFEQMHQWAIELIKKGKAYVCDLSADEVHQSRGSLKQSGTESPYRNRSIEENLELFIKMKNGEFPDGSHTLRAKIDMAHSNVNMRDPVMYRILHASHPHAGDKWCIYPMYDWAHGLEDSIEGITHSLCTLEFENHRPLYDWFIVAINENRGPHSEYGPLITHPQQIEFARLNLNYTVMSKRMLAELVKEKFTQGWDDPRLPTIRGMRRRGYSPASIREFCNRIGMAKVNSTVDFSLLESCIRDDLNKTAQRLMGVLRPLKVIIDNYDEDLVEHLDAVNNPEDESAGTRKIPFSKSFYIEHDDFMEDPPNKFYRLAPGREVRLRYAYYFTCTDLIKDDENIIELHGSIDPETKGGYAPDGRRVKATIHWVSADHARDAEVRLYDRLFTVENPLKDKTKDFKEYLNPDSFKVLQNCKVEPSITQLKPFDRFQFERLGYFCIDPDSKEGKPVINQTVTLRDTWARLQQKQ